MVFLFIQNVAGKIEKGFRKNIMVVEKTFEVQTFIMLQRCQKERCKRDYNTFFVSNVFRKHETVKNQIT